MSEAIDFKIRISDLTVRLTGLHQHTLDFCRDYLVESEDFDLWVTATEEDTLAEIARHAEVDSPEYYEKICLYRQIAERLPELDRFVFHGAAVEIGGRGFIFTAPSGTGKTTHIGLLLENYPENVDIINGDKPIVHIPDGGARVCSTPWAGKEGMNRNVSPELAGIVLLRRGEVNRIREVQPSDHFAAIMAQTYFPNDALARVRTLELLDKLAKQVKFYVLECNISDDAAKTSFEFLK